MASHKKARKDTQVQKEYRKERNRIQRQMNRMHKRGYYGMEDMLPAIPKKITKASVRRLKRITTKDLYDKADFIDLTTGEVIATGEQGRAIERKRATEKAQETRRKRREVQAWQKEIQEAGERDRQAREEQWREQRQRQDEQNKRRLQQDQQYARQFDTGAITERKVRGVLDDHRRDFPNTVADLERLIESAEGDEGYDELWSRLSEHDDLVDTLEEIFYKAGDHISVTAFNHFREIVLNRVMSAEEMRDAQDMYEQDQNNSFDIDEEP